MVKKYSSWNYFKISKTIFYDDYYIMYNIIKSKNQHFILLNDIYILFIILYYNIIILLYYNIIILLYYYIIILLYYYYYSYYYNYYYYYYYNYYSYYYY